MKKFTLNREFFVRHLGVTLLMAGLGCWFVFDGAVTYPKMDAVEFCEKHHKSLENPEREKAEAIKRQYQFASIAFIAALAIGCHLLKVRGESLAWDDEKMIGSLTFGKEARFANCAGDGGSVWGGTDCVDGTPESFFRDYAAGDYRPSTGGPLFDKGANCEPIPAFDLSGVRPRKIGNRIDIGCYEANAALTMFILR